MTSGLGVFGYLVFGQDLQDLFGGDLPLVDEWENLILLVDMLAHRIHVWYIC